MRFLKNGQWTLEPLKKAYRPGSPEDPGSNLPSIHRLMGENPDHFTTHTVEVHPDMDHLYNVKGLIQESGQPRLKLADIKKTGQFGHIIDRIPRDPKGWVTPQLIDQHIAKLPKHKVDIQVTPYEMDHQMHRGGSSQYVASVGFHPETLKSMHPAHAMLWNGIKDKQHELGGHPHQIGWARIDPYKADRRDTHTAIVPNEGHWHLDEIQSDFGTPSKLTQMINYHIDPKHIAEEIGAQHPETPEFIPLNEKTKELHSHIKNAMADGYHDDVGALQRELNKVWEEIDRQRAISGERIAKERQTQLKSAGLGKNFQQDLMRTLSHGHEDPQHLIHSAVNQLARQNGITSTSMDLPHHQAEQSGLHRKEKNYQDTPAQKWSHDIFMYHTENPLSQEESNSIWEQHGKDLATRHFTDIDFKRAQQKLGEEGIRHWAHLPTQDLSSWMFGGGSDEDWKENLNVYKDVFPKETREKLLQLNANERDALGRYAMDLRDPIERLLSQKAGLPLPEGYPNHYQLERQREEAQSNPMDDFEDVPVHFTNTYVKRPKKLGMQVAPKKDILGDYSGFENDDADERFPEVQYAKLYKKLKILQEILKKHA